MIVDHDDFKGEFLLPDQGLEARAQAGLFVARRDDYRHGRLSVGWICRSHALNLLL
jgi:hypothetical protein